ncbi:MAG: hypothetical protein C0622_06275 [Desulfuromonas sp.]|nr:MAG: hypothetical protein C0622_06275 [Desulfuromonas sp.]
MDPMLVYKTGLVIVALFALFWSFVLDRKKPPTVKEFTAKLLARALFLAFFYTVLIGFAYLAFGLLSSPPQS